MVLTQNRYGDQCNKTKGPNMVHATRATWYLTKTRRTQMGEKCLLQMELAQLVPPGEEYYTPISHLVRRATPNELKIQPWKLLEESIGSAYLILVWKKAS